MNKECIYIAGKIALLRMAIEKYIEDEDGNLKFSEFCFDNGYWLFQIGSDSINITVTSSHIEGLYDALHDTIIKEDLVNLLHVVL